MINKYTSSATISGSFILLCFYLLIDYARIQDIINIGFLRPGMLAIIMMSIAVLCRNDFQLNVVEVRLMFYFSILLCLYIPFSVNNFYAYRTFKSFVMFLPFILLSISCLDTIKKFNSIINFLILISIYISISSLNNSGRGTGGYFNDENDLSLFLNMIIPFCYFLFLYHKNNLKKRIFYLLSLLICLMATIFTFSRGGFVGLSAIGMVIWILSSKKLITLFIIILISSFLFLYAGDAYWYEMSTVTDMSESTAQARIQSWISAWRMFLDHPFGVGGNNFQVLFSQYQTDYFTRGMWGRVSHSLWFTLLSETGIIGIFIYLSLLRNVFLRLMKLRKYIYADASYVKCLTDAFLASFAGFFVSGSFLSVLYYPHFWYFVALVVAFDNVIKSEMTMVEGEHVHI